MSQRVWVVVDERATGSPMFRTIRQTRLSAIRSYEEYAGGLVSFREMQAAGYARPPKRRKPA